jgi:hypothetical protein
MPHRPFRQRRSRLSLAAVAFVLVALLLNVPGPARASGPVSPAVSAAAYTVTWNGADVSAAGSASSALVIDLTQQANLLFNWTLSAPNTADVSDARIQMFYFGFAVATRDQVLTNPVARASGSIPLSWTPLSVAYLLEGVYRITASFIAANGSTLFSENFYVRDNAPLGIVAILPIVLLAIMVYEVYGLARSGRYEMIGRVPPAATTASAPPSTGGGPSGGGSETSSTGSDSTRPSPPPSGGGAS